MTVLPGGFPFRSVFEEFLERYSHCNTYWYVQKFRVLNDDNVNAMQSIMLTIFDRFLGKVWNPTTQDELLDDLVQAGIMDPTAQRAILADRTALIRISKKLLETLGFLWVQNNRELIITDAGLELIVADDPRPVIEGQVAKYQYPNPTVVGAYATDFKGIVPHLFLLQVLQQTDYRLSVDEYELFVNLAQGQDDVHEIVRLVRTWRDLNEEEKQQLLEITAAVPMAGAQGYTRYKRIHLDSSYQRAFFAYPSYLKVTKEGSHTIIGSDVPQQIDAVLQNQSCDLKVTVFQFAEDWFAYYGVPTQRPSWYTFLQHEVQQASTQQAAEIAVAEYEQHLTVSQKDEIRKLQIEKGIEDFYVGRLTMLEPSLQLVEDGRQYVTPIGRIDLLCTSDSGEFVVIEIKVDEANDAVFGQILRYIGWVHRNLPLAENNVRGIILAGQFPETARYSRIGLLKADYERFIQFKRHGLYAANT